MLDEATLSRLKIELASGEYPGLASVYLFGSEAEGRAHRESDIDLAVLLDPALPGGADARFEVRLRLIGRIEPLLAGRPLDLMILNDCPPLFARRLIGKAGDSSAPGRRSTTPSSGTFSSWPPTWSLGCAGCGSSSWRNCDAHEPPC